MAIFVQAGTTNPAAKYVQLFRLVASKNALSFWVMDGVLVNLIQ
jgi:hypothetical protein